MNPSPSPSTQGYPENKSAALALGKDSSAAQPKAGYPE